MAGMKSMTLAQAIKLIKSMPVKYAALAAIGVSTGCRISEILMLRRFDLIDSEGNFKQRVTFVKLKSRAQKERKLIIPIDFQRFIIKHLNEEAERGYERPDDYVFRGKYGKSLSRLAAYHFFRRTLGRGYGTHFMRKTFAQLMFKFFLEQNVSDPMRALELVRQALGHERIDTTIKYLGFDTAVIDNAQNEIFSIKKRQKNG